MPERDSGAGAEPADAMRARVRESFGRQAMMTALGAELASVARGRGEAFADGAAAPFAAMQATIVYGRPGIRH